MLSWGQRKSQFGAKSLSLTSVEGQIVTHSLRAQARREHSFHTRIYRNLHLGHPPSMHWTVSAVGLSLSQPFPPFRGGGELHTLLRTFTPVPHVALHKDHMLHSLYPPSTARQERQGTYIKTWSFSPANSLLPMSFTLSLKVTGSEGPR